MAVSNLKTDNEDKVTITGILLRIVEWYQYLKSKWLLIFLFGFLGALIGVGYAFLKKPVYTATTTFVLEEGEKSGGFGGLGGLASMAGIDLGSGGGGIFQGENILALYKSRTMLEKTLLSRVSISGKPQLLVERYIEANKLRETWKKNPGLLAIDFNRVDTLRSASEIRLKDSLMSTIVADINMAYLTIFKPDKKLNTLQVDVKAKDEVFAKLFNERLVKNVNDFYISTITKKSVRNISILQHKTDSVRAVMNGAIFSSAAVADATPNLNPTRQIRRVVPMQQSQFTAETNKAVLSTLLQNLELAKMSLLKEQPLIQVIDEPIYPLYKKRTSKTIFLVLGGILGALATTIVLIGKRVIRNLTADA
ncbi:Wzz/FepE/Etk N-terminal domain-containing protein [Pedobacter suwonensis]|uniref:Wzz/FepE/Etk N-terminal domain-containing protein n=1 Tax=Pedobacter suwonensis TaxID=332999 RepID=UPI0011A527D9|nr:Wzz/FepE/Etk N-terminal domain-containing protein [Pedobacter suwonensis]